MRIPIKSAVFCGSNHLISSAAKVVRLKLKQKKSRKIYRRNFPFKSILPDKYRKNKVGNKSFLSRKIETEIREDPLLSALKHYAFIKHLTSPFPSPVGKGKGRVSTQ